MDKVQGLIQVLMDLTAREDEREDAAMDLGQCNDDRALDALIHVGSNPLENYFILDACGESIAEILIDRNEFKKGVEKILVSRAQRVYMRCISEYKPEWSMNFEDN